MSHVDTSLSSGDKVWLPCPKNGFRKATVTEVDGEWVYVSGETSGSKERRARTECRNCFELEAGVTSQDNTALVHLHDASILDNLQRRYKKDEIYTYTASVLLAVNPYKNLPGMYSEEKRKEYCGKFFGSLPPHPYALADAAYRILMREGQNQAFVISGESGAGKTETAKIVMQHLVHASGSNSEISDSAARFLQTQPILESFGNAATLRNHNSSRFGKYNSVYFDSKGNLADSGTTTYLLESSRVIHQAEGERNYHVFHEMLAGLSDEQMAAVKLDRSASYKLVPKLSKEKAKIFVESDKAHFVRLTNALGSIGIDDGMVSGIFQVISGILHLGNMPKDEAEAGEDDDEVDDNEEGSALKRNDVNLEHLEAASELLGIDADELRGVWKLRRIKIPGRQSCHMVNRKKLNAEHTLQALIKNLYKRAFDKVVSLINASFQTQASEDRETCKQIGILDIYGFERLQTNSFEQLCINLANERLQHFFVENVLLGEQSLFKREGLPWNDVKLPDSTPVVNTIATVFKVLDEFCIHQSKGLEGKTDAQFCERCINEVSKEEAQKKVLTKLKMTGGRHTKGLAQNEGFLIMHYAGEVQYSTKSWLDKNNDRVLPEIEELISGSSKEIVSSLADEEDNTKGFRSVSKKYHANLEELLSTLGSCQVRYIRCFKPNATQSPKDFDAQLVLDQLVQCGTVELVKIMHDGFPNRCTFEEILTRFKNLLPPQFERYGLRTFVMALMKSFEVPEEDYALGMSRLFLKAGQLKMLETLRSEGVQPKLDILAQIARDIVLQKWRRGARAISFCIWLPKYVAKLRRERLLKILRRGCMIFGRIMPLIRAARERIQKRKDLARRRAFGLIKASCLICRWWQRLKIQRRERLTRQFFRSALFVRFLQQRAVAARARVAEARAKAEAERLERERVEKERLEAERLERERLEAERLEQERLEKERLEAERLERERLEAERLEQERLEKERLEAERLEQERLEAERLEQERLERERIENERLEQERLEKERLEKERLEQERLEQERLEQERLEKERLEMERLEQERIEKERLEKLEQERLEQERLAAEEEKRLEEERRLEAERLAAEEEKRLQEERRIEEERKEQERLEKERLEAEKLAAEFEMAPPAKKADDVSFSRRSMSSDRSKRPSTGSRVSHRRSHSGDARTPCSSKSTSKSNKSDENKVSASPGVVNVVELHKHIQQLESRFAQQQAEQMIEIQRLKQKNADLEEKVQVDKNRLHARARTPSLSPDKNGRRGQPKQGSPQRSPPSQKKRRSLSEDSRPSLLAITPSDEKRAHSPDMTPRMTPPGSTHKRASPHTHESQRLSLISGITATGNDGIGSNSRHRISLAKSSAARKSFVGKADVGSERTWWAEQRNSLLEDLYPYGGPLTMTPGSSSKFRKSLVPGETPTGGKKNRTSVAKNLDMQLEGVGSRVDENKENNRRCESIDSDTEVPELSGNEKRRRRPESKMRQPKVFYKKE